MKGKLVIGILVGIAATLFVQKNKWCQEKLQTLKEKGEEFLEKHNCQCQAEEQQPAEETK